MYNLNVNLAETAATAANNLLVETEGPTPRTPEILNSVIAMTNPLDSYFAVGRRIKNGPPTNLSTDSNSSCSSQVESPTCNNPPSVQRTCSQLIKAGLKLSIEQKRKHQQDSEDLLDLDKCSKRIKKITECSESEEDRLKYEHGLTPEDEERRRRRRERNKIAATKCRLKKRERTVNLIGEAEILETQNVDMKNQLQELHQQKRTLEDLLAQHRPLCDRNVKRATRASLYKLPPVSSVIDNHSYQTPSSVTDDDTFRSTIEYVQQRCSSEDLQCDPYLHNNNNDHYKTPSIIIEDVSDTCNTPHLIDLDNHLSHNGYYHHHQCHSDYSNNQNYNNGSGMDSGCMA